MKIKNEEAVQEPPKACTEVCLSWKMTNGIYRGFSFLSYMFSFLPSIILFIAFLTVFTWVLQGTSDSPFEALEALAEYKEVLKTVRVLICIAVCVMFISFTYPSYVYYSAPIKLRQYALINKIDLVKSLDYTLSTDFTNKSKYAFRKHCASAYLVMNAILYQKDYNAQGKAERVFIGSVISNIVSLIFLLVFLLKNAEVCVNHYVFTTDLSQLPKLTYWWALILWFVTSFVPGIFLSSKWQQPVMRNWIKKNLPQRYYAYEKYVAPMTRYNPTFFIK